jgi:hypothetical protein
VQQPDRGGQEVQLGVVFFKRGEEGEKSMKEVRYDFLVDASFLWCLDWQPK